MQEGGIGVGGRCLREVEVLEVSARGSRDAKVEMVVLISHQEVLTLDRGVGGW